MHAAPVTFSVLHRGVGAPVCSNTKLLKTVLGAARFKRLVFRDQSKVDKKRGSSL